MTAIPKDERGPGSPSAVRASVNSTSELLLPLLERAVAMGVETRFQVDGVSMRPLVRPLDVVCMRTDTEDTRRIGAVVAVRGNSARGILVHRLVGYRGTGLVLKGDNCLHEDGCFDYEDLLGMVTRVERNGHSVWYGAGRLGPLVAWAVRHGLIWRANRIYYGARRLAGSALKFLGADSRLRPRKGDDGNE